MAKGLLTEDGTLTEKAVIILDEMETYLVKQKKKVATAVLGDNFLDKVKEYREIFPAMRLPQHNQMARQTVQELKDKFIWFFKTYPEFTWEDVLDATDYYIFTKERENWVYTSTSSMFIKKTDIRSREVTSKLADYCQIIKENPDILQNT